MISRIKVTALILLCSLWGTSYLLTIVAVFRVFYKKWLFVLQFFVRVALVWMLLLQRWGKLTYKMFGQNICINLVNGYVFKHSVGVFFRWIVCMGLTTISLQCLLPWIQQTTIVINTLRENHIHSILILPQNPLNTQIHLVVNHVLWHDWKIAN